MNPPTPYQLERQARARTIRAQMKNAAPQVFSQFPVEIAYLHGSVARGTPLPTSDIDVAVVLSEMLPPHKCLELEFALQAALEDATGLSEMDVRAINQAPITVQGEIVQTGQLLYERDKERRVEFEILVRKKYFDYAPRAEMMQKAFLKRVREKGILRGQSKKGQFH